MLKLFELFGNLIKEDYPPAFKDAELYTCELDPQSRTLDIGVRFSCYVDNKIINDFKETLISAFSLKNLDFEEKFPPEALNETACADICERIKAKNAAINGYLNQAEYTLNGDNVTVTLKFGGLLTLRSCEFESKFERAVFKLFEREVTVSFDGQAEDVKIKIPKTVKTEPPKRQTKEKAANKAAVKFEPRSDKPENGLVYLDDPRVIYGPRNIDTNVKEMIRVTEEDTYICCFGEVFGREDRKINTRNGERVIVKFSFSDHTNALCASMFVKPENLTALSVVKDGHYILVNGSYKFDDYKKSFIVEPKSIALLQKYEETDDYEGKKRVELHCHTNMSAKDAVSSAGDIINCAYKWGHTAIAITDHGVVQSYPAAAAAVSAIRKNGGNFKVIYGVESYFIDDYKNKLDGLTTKQIAKLRNHQIILVKNLTGLKNLYKIVSNAHLENFHGRPITLKSVLDKFREGLIVGTACEQGELYKAIVDGADDEELKKIASYYDYLEIQPLGNNEFMVRESSLPDKVSEKTGQIVKVNRFKKVKSLEVIKDFNRKVVEIADALNKPVVATGDVHFLTKEDGIIRQIVMAGQGFDDIENQAPLYFKTTSEMLSDFDYFGERAKEFVIDNPNKIADMISDDVIPVPEGNYPPVIEGSDQLLEDICWETAHRIYGEKLPEIVEKRLKKELDSIIKNGFSIMYISAQKLVAYSEKKGYLVGSRGSVGSSFVATMAGISEVNPLAPHYVCPKCKYSKFFTDGSVGSGFDLPEDNCPVCGEKLNRNGHDIPFETFLGFKGDKVPDIDLNFSDEVQNDVQEYTKSLFGEGNVFKAGTISTIAEKTAYGFAKAYCEKTGKILSPAELDRLAKKVEGAKVKTTTGQHPAGMIIVPDGMEIYDFCPVQHPADDVKSDIITTHFDFHSIHDTILKLDELGHVIPTTYKYLEEYTGIPVSDVSMSDPEVYSLFTSTKALGVEPEDIDSQNGTFCLPEFGTKFVREMLMDCKPKNFADLLQISGLSHGTDVYLGNAKDLIDNGTCTISEVIGTRDNIMVYLIHRGMEEGRAFKITETVRKGLVAKGKVSKEDWSAMEDDMRAVGVPEWYIKSCYKIKYMFPKAHAAAYVISALRVAWYKVHKPLEFYCAYFTARPEDVDVEVLMGGKESVRRYLRDIKAKGKEASKKELDVYENMLIFNEMLSRGIEILPIDIEKSHAVKFVPENGKMRLPFGALSGVGEKAAYSIYEAAKKGNFVSREDLIIESGVSKTVIAKLGELGALGSIPETNQISMF